MSIRSVNVVSHFTDWTIGHVHSGALGWNAMITYGTFYFMVPRLVGRELFSTRLANIHFWLALAGTMLYIMAMWAAGVSQGLLWLSLDETGELAYSFRDIMSTMVNIGWGVETVQIFLSDLFENPGEDSGKLIESSPTN